MPLSITLVAIYSDRHLALKERFENSLKDTDITVVIEAVADIGTGDGSFQSDGWYNALRTKIAVILHWIRKLKHRGGILVASDVDIQFFRPIRPTIESLFAVGGPDLAFQRENADGSVYNGGFIVMRCSDRVEQFYQDLLDGFIPRGLADQDWINEHIHHSGLSHVSLPSQIWAYTQSPGDPPLGILLHHANFTTAATNGVKQKLDQLDEIAYIVSTRDFFDSNPIIDTVWTDR